MQRIVICDPKDESRDHLRTLLLGIDFAFLDAECKRYEAFYDIVADNPPDLSVIQLDSDPIRSVALVSHLTAHFPQVPILVVSKNHGAILEALQGGAKHFLTEPVTLEDVLKVVRRVLADGEQITTSGSGVSHVSRVGTNSHVIAVLGSRGGIGCTTFAVNLASCIAAEPDQEVALIDLDLALGDAGIHLSVSPNYTLTDLATNIDKLDLNFLKRSLVRHEPTGLSFLDRPVSVADIDVVEGAHVERVLNLLKLSYTQLVVDASKRFTAVDGAAIAVADAIVLVVQLELTSVLNATRILQAIGTLDGMDERIKIVLNKVGVEELEDERHRISLKKAEEIIGKPFFWQVPYDPRATTGARNEGVPLIKFAPRSRSHQSLVGLAAALTNKDVSPIVTTSNPGFLRSLFKK